MNNKQCIIFFLSIFFINIFVKIIKKIIKQQRPIPSNTYGMPSSKSSVMTFILVYLTCINNFERKTIFFIVIISIITILIKYFYQEHSLTQLFAGILLGFIIALISYCFSR